MPNNDLKPFRLTVRGVLQDKDGRFLLLKRSQNNATFAGCWEFPGGKVDPGENFAESLVREFKEETGLDVGLTKVLGAGEAEKPEFKIAYLFMEVVHLSGEFVMSDEHDDYAWMDSDELRDADVSPQLNPLVNSLCV